MSVWTQKATKGGGNFAKAPAGNHLAVLVGLIDMGHQWNEGYQGAPGRYSPKAYFVYELVSEKVTGTAKNHLIATDLTVSVNEKAKLRKWVEARTGTKIPEGADYDITQELGKPCLLNVIMRGEWPAIDGVAAVPKGMAVPEPLTKPLLWSLDGDYKPTGKIELPEWVPYLYGKPLRDHIAACREIVGTGSTAAPNGRASRPPASGGGSPGSPPPVGGPPEQKWWVIPAKSNEPLPDLKTAADILAMLHAGQDPHDIRVCPDGGTSWVKCAGAVPNCEVPF